MRMEVLPMNDVILRIAGLAKRFGGLQATCDVSLDILRNETHALIGPNGAGKTTLINQLHGAFFPDEGTVTFDGAEITRQPVNVRALRGLSRSFQISQVVQDFTAQQNVALAVQAGQGHSFRFWRSVDQDEALQEPAYAALETVDLQQRAHARVSQLSHGERRQLEIAIALAMKPKLLLLDEPMAGMGRNESARLVQLLAKLKGRYTIVMVEHDMDAVFSLADRVSVLVQGRLIATGTPAEVRCNPAVQAAYLGHGH
jgi:branched-chain amino acid transport system ATP-binding protein